MRDLQAAYLPVTRLTAHPLLVLNGANMSGAPIITGTKRFPLEMESTSRSNPLKEPAVRVASHPAQHYDQSIIVRAM